MSNILYKYLDINGAKCMIGNQNLQFTNASQLNDPFDCHPKLIDYSNVPESKLQGWVPKEWWMEKEENDALNLRNETWLCSLSKVYDSLLMWSHYCYNHKGVCIGLDIDKVMQSVPPMFGTIYLKPFVIEVQYRNIIERPDAHQSAENIFLYQWKTKAKEWQYEQEVRLVMPNPSAMYAAFTPEQAKQNKEIWNWKEIRHYMPLKAECFESIYLGVNIEQTEKEKVTQLAKTLNPDIKIYQMEIDSDSFNLISKLERNYELADYIDLFSNLHTNKQHGKSAPHKAIMLLSVIDLISSQHITTNEIIYNEELEKCFLKNWKRYVKEVSIFKPKAGTPFWHLNSEPFWQLIPYEGGYRTIVKLQKGNPYSVATIRKHIKYAVIDKELFLLLQNGFNREILINTLRATIE